MLICGSKKGNINCENAGIPLQLIEIKPKKDGKKSFEIAAPELKRGLECADEARTKLNSKNLCTSNRLNASEAYQAIFLRPFSE